MSRNWPSVLAGVTLALLLAAPTHAGIRPSSDVLVPYFEVDLQPGVRTTYFAVVNHASEAVHVAVALHSTWGIHIITSETTIGANAVATANLTDWLLHGQLWDRTLTAEELAHVQAALSGQPSPRDGKYYGGTWNPNQAEGYITASVLGSTPPDSLWGDTFVCDTACSLFEGETLVNLDRSVDEHLPCLRHGIRFLNAAAPHIDTELNIWNPHVIGPLTTPAIPESQRVLMHVEVYDEAGNLIQTRDLRLQPLDVVRVADLQLPVSFGWFEIWGDANSSITAHVLRNDRNSMAFHSYCLPQLAPPTEGPSITLDKLLNGAHQHTPPGALLNIGATIAWGYVVTNTGTVALTAVAVTDSGGFTITCPKSTLDPGESMTCTASSTAVACLNQNTATAVGTSPTGVQVSAQDIGYYTGATGATLAIEKSTNGDPADTPPGPALWVGDAVAWTYAVTNGPVALTGVAVVDNRGVAVTCPKTALAAGESMTCTASGVALAGQYSNIGQASGRDSCLALVNASDPSHYFGRTRTQDQGCSPGYWKNHAASWLPTGYSTGQTVASVFSAGAYPALAGSSLSVALSFGGGPGLDGAAQILLRAGVAALLNSAHPGVSYPLTGAEVVAEVNLALASSDRDTMLLLAGQLDAANNLGCPLN